MREYYERNGIAAKGRLNVMVLFSDVSVFFRMKHSQIGDGIHVMVVKKKTPSLHCFHLSCSNPK